MTHRIVKLALATLLLGAADLVVAQVGRAMPGLATILENPYGTLTVTGGLLLGNKIANLQSGAVIQLGTQTSSGTEALRIQFDGFVIGSGNVLTIRGGSGTQRVVISTSGPLPADISGSLIVENSPNSAVQLTVSNTKGVKVSPTGVVESKRGLTLSGLGDTWYGPGDLTVEGTVDGGEGLRLLGHRITGGGQFKANSVWLSTLTDANNPVHGNDFLANGLNIYRSFASNSSVQVTLHAYGSAPQFINLKVHDQALLDMPAKWYGWDNDIPSNNAVATPALPFFVPFDYTIPSYGGGSLIVQSTRTMYLIGDMFAFPGAIVLKSQEAIDMSHLLVMSQAWTTSGQPFQGIFLEAPRILGNGYYTNYNNWINFSTRPVNRVGAMTLHPAGPGKASLFNTNATSFHLNTYSVIAKAAVDGECWTCLVNTTPFNVDEPPIPPAPPAPVCTVTASHLMPTFGESVVLAASCSGHPTAFVWDGCASTTSMCVDSGATPGPKTYVFSATNAGGRSEPVTTTVTWRTTGG